MITVNTYVVSEKAVYQGVSLGVKKLLEDVKNFNNPDVVVDTITGYVMSELCDVMEFGSQPLKFTPDIMRKLYQLAEQEETPHPAPTAKSD